MNCLFFCFGLTNLLTGMVFFTGCCVEVQYCITRTVRNQVPMISNISSTKYLCLLRIYCFFLISPSSFFPENMISGIIIPDLVSQFSQNSIEVVSSADTVLISAISLRMNINSPSSANFLLKNINKQYTFSLPDLYVTKQLFLPQPFVCFFQTKIPAPDPMIFSASEGLIPAPFTLSILKILCEESSMTATKL